MQTDAAGLAIQVVFKLPIKKGDKKMKAFQTKKTGGYSFDRASQYIDVESAALLLTTEAIPMKKFEDNKPTDVVEFYRYWFLQEGTEPFEVKLKEELSSPTYLGNYVFENIEATLFNNNVFFRADSAKAVK